MRTLDIDECAEFFKIQRTHALKLAGAGEIPGAKIGKSWVFLEDDLADYLRAQVRQQSRERAAEHEVHANLDKRVMQPLSPMHRRPKKERPKLSDLDGYFLDPPAAS